MEHRFKFYITRWQHLLDVVHAMMILKLSPSTEGSHSLATCGGARFSLCELRAMFLWHIIIFSSKMIVICDTLLEGDVIEDIFLIHVNDVLYMYISVTCGGSAPKALVCVLYYLFSLKLDNLALHAAKEAESLSSQIRHQS